MTHNFTKSKLTLLGSLLVFTLGCDKAKNASETNPDDPSTVSSTGGVSPTVTSVVADQPSDSTGATGNVVVSFTSPEAIVPSLGLAATGIDLGGGLVVLEAKANIATIKLKASKEMSESEQAFRKELKEQKKLFEKEIESEKDAIENEKEDLEKAFEVAKELEGADEKALKAQLKIDMAAVEEKKAVLESQKDEKEQLFEAENDKNVKWKGPYLYDIVNSTMTPELPTVEVTDGSYQRIEFKIKPNRTADGSELILNNSIIVSGTYNDVPFNVLLDKTEEFRLSGAGAFAVDSDAGNNLNVAFSLVKWFENIDLSGAVAVNGLITISELDNINIYKDIRRNIKMSTRFGKDEDGDGKLGIDEDEGDGSENVADLESEDQEDENESGDDSSSDSEDGE